MAFEGAWVERIMGKSCPHGRIRKFFFRGGFMKGSWLAIKAVSRAREALKIAVIPAKAGIQ
jgi:hypothetical protein